ncbi:DUF411 domain-containing protein [Rhodoferax potami]
MRTRRTVLASIGALLAVPVRAAKPPATPMEVWKDPNCGCCKDWVKHLEQAGFTVRVYDIGNEAKRAALGMPQALGSCHTGVVGGYAIEGHVPAKDIQRLLREKPKALGLSVPGMPIGSPGMDGAIYKGRKDPFDVLLVAANGNSTVFQSYR